MLGSLCLDVYSIMYNKEIPEGCFSSSRYKFKFHENAYHTIKRPDSRCYLESAVCQRHWHMMGTQQLGGMDSRLTLIMLTTRSRICLTDNLLRQPHSCKIHNFACQHKFYKLNWLCWHNQWLKTALWTWRQSYWMKISAHISIANPKHSTPSIDETKALRLLNKVVLVFT